MNETNFTSLAISEELQKAIADMGFTEMTPIQRQAIPSVLAGKDVIAQAPTGTGKTCAYAIPSIERINTSDESVQVLVLCPTRELAVQSVKEIQLVTKYKEAIRVMAIYGGQSIDRQILTLKKRPQIVVGTPGRIMDHLRRGTLKLKNLRILVLDEADEMLNMGFREDIDTILESVNQDRDDLQTILFSATMPRTILEISKNYQKKDTVTFKAERIEENKQPIKQFYIEVKENDKEELLSRLVDANNFKLILVFCRTKKRVDDLCLGLQSRGHSAEALHGDLKQAQRDKVMQKFRQGIMDILVATDVAARGIDIDDIEAVFNFDVTDDVEYYIHRIGRTGRAGRLGQAYSFINRKQYGMIADYEKATKSRIEKAAMPSAKMALNSKVKQYINSVDPILVEGELNDYAAIIEEKLAELNNNDIGVFYTPLQIAAGLLKKGIGSNKPAYVSEVTYEEDRPSSKRERGDRSSERRPSSNRMEFSADPSVKYQRFFINLGEKDAINKSELVDLIVSKVPNLKKEQFNDAFILPSFSFFEAPFDLKDEIISSLNGDEYNDRTIAVETAEGRNSKPYSGEKRSYGRSSSSESGERKPYNRSSEGGEKRSYGRSSSSESGERRSYSRSSEGGEKRSYGRSSSSEGGERKSYSRSSEGGEKRSYTKRSTNK